MGNVGQALSRKHFKKMLMKLAGVNNRYRWSGFGTAIAMTEEVQSSESNRIHCDIYKVLIHRAVMTGKMHTAKQIIEPVANFAISVGMAQLGPKAGVDPLAGAISGLSGSVSDLGAFDVDTSELGIIYRDAVFRNEKKKDRWNAASQCSLIVSRILVKVVQNRKDLSAPIVVYINNNAQNTDTLNSWYNALLNGVDVSMVPHTYNILNKKLSHSTGGAVPVWAQQQ